MSKRQEATINDRVHDQVDELMEPALDKAAGLLDELNAVPATELLTVGIGYVESLLDSGEPPSRGGQGSSRRAAKSEVLS